MTSVLLIIEGVSKGFNLAFWHVPVTYGCLSDILGLCFGILGYKLTWDAFVLHLQILTKLIMSILCTFRHVRLHDCSNTGRVTHTSWPIIDQVHGIIDAVARTIRAVGALMTRAWLTGWRLGGFSVLDSDTMERSTDFNHLIRWTLEGDFGNTSTLETLAGFHDICGGFGDKFYTLMDRW